MDVEVMVLEWLDRTELHDLSSPAGSVVRYLIGNLADVEALQTEETDAVQLRHDSDATARAGRSVGCSMATR